MGIDFHKYRPQKGIRTSLYQRVFALTKNGSYKLFKSKWILVLIILTYFFGVVTKLINLVFGSSNLESSFFIDFYEEGQLWFVLMAAVAGSGLIANDLKHRTVVLYLIRIPKKVYLAGKTGIIGSVLSVVILLPGIILFFVAVVSSTEPWSTFVENLSILGAVAIMGMLIILLLSTVSLAISSLTSDKRYAGAGIFIIFMFSDILSGLLRSIIDNDSLAMVSVWNNVRVVGRHLFGVETPYSYPWYDSLAVLAVVFISSASILYYTVFKKEVWV